MKRKGKSSDLETLTISTGQLYWSKKLERESSIQKPLEKTKLLEKMWHFSRVCSILIGTEKFFCTTMELDCLGVENWNTREKIHWIAQKKLSQFKFKQWPVRILRIGFNFELQVVFQRQFRPSFRVFHFAPLLAVQIQDYEVIWTYFEHQLRIRRHRVATLETETS